MKSYLRMAVLLSFCYLPGCSDPPVASESAPALPVTTAPNQTSEDRQGVLTDTQREGLNAANQMSETLRKAEEERRKQMEAQGI